MTINKIPPSAVFRIDAEDAQRGQDYYTEERQAFIAEGYIEARRREAIAWLGKRWILHPDNRVGRLERPYRPILWREAA
jgi:hypothetical protein